MLLCALGHWVTDHLTTSKEQKKRDVNRERHKSVEWPSTTVNVEVIHRPVRNVEHNDILNRVVTLLRRLDPRLNVEVINRLVHVVEDNEILNRVVTFLKHLDQSSRPRLNFEVISIDSRPHRRAHRCTS